MRKLILIAHTSLDGFVAGTKGEFDGFIPGEESLGLVNKICENADAALFGRISYQLLEQFWPHAAQRQGATAGEIKYSNWYNRVTKIVASKSLPGEARNEMIIGEDLADEIRTIKSSKGRDIVLFGSPSVAQQLMRENLIDIYWIFINSIVFGRGIPLFKEMDQVIKLKLFETKGLPNAEFALGFEMLNAPSK